MVIFPADAELAKRADFRRMRMAQPDQQGRFRAEHLPPGDYLAAAVVDFDMQDGVRARLPRRPAPGRQAVPPP